MPKDLKKSIDQSVAWCQRKIADLDAFRKKWTGRTLSSRQEEEADSLLKKLKETFDRMETNWEKGQDECEDDNLLTELHDKFVKIEKEVKKSTEEFHDFIESVPTTTAAPTATSASPVATP